MRPIYRKYPARTATISTTWQGLCLEIKELEAFVTCLRLAHGFCTGPVLQRQDGMCYINGCAEERQQGPAHM